MKGSRTFRRVRSREGGGSNRDSRRSGADWGHAREARSEDLAERLAYLREKNTEGANARWFLPLGALLRDVGQLDEAAFVLRQGLARDPDCLSGWVILGQCVLELGELAVAKGLFESVAARDPENVLVLGGLARISALEDDRERAADFYRALLKLKPRDLAAQEALASLLDPDPGLRPHRGIFEPLPADLDGEESLHDEPPGRRDGDAERSDAIERRAPSREGYRRWIERLEREGRMGREPTRGEPLGREGEAARGQEPAGRAWWDAGPRDSTILGSYAAEHGARSEGWQRSPDHPSAVP